MKRENGILILLALSLLLAMILMFIDYFFSNPPVDISNKTFEYEGNIKGSFWKYSSLMVLEVLACYLLIFYRKNRYRIFRVVIFIISFIALMIYTFFQTMHGGGVIAICFFWQIFLMMILLGYFILDYLIVR